jgi:DNA-binding IclR family transcriptional regulator
METGKKDKNPIQVSERLNQVFEALADNGSLHLKDLCSLVGLNKSTVHRLLESLICLGYVRKNAESGCYELSFKIVEISQRLLDRMDMGDEIRPYLKKLAKATGETVHLVIQDGTNAVYIEKVESFENSIHMASRIGSKVPLYCSGVGKAICAELTDDKLISLWMQSDIAPLTENTITDYAVFTEKIAEIRKNGYAVDDEENEIGVRCIAAALPLRGQTGRYAFSIAAPANRITDDRIPNLAEKVLQIKKEISEHFS